MSNLQSRYETFLMPVPEVGCWLWTGSTDRKGYGQISDGPGIRRAHRLAWELNRGSIPDGALVLHKCDTPQCCNPDHLYLGTFSDNRRDMLDRKRWSHPYGQRDACAKGHNYEEHGYYLAKRDGSRCCRTCARDAKRAQRSKQ